MKRKILYSHNAYLCKEPIKQAFAAKCNMIETDVFLSWGKVRNAHFWKPLPCMYQGTLEDVFLKPLYRLAKFDCLPPNFWFYIESKSFNPLLWKPLFKLMSRYKHKNIHYCMSVQDRYIHQWPRRWWFRIFMKRYSYKLEIINKKIVLESLFDVSKIDLYEKTWFRELQRKITEFLRGIFK